MLDSSLHKFVTAQILPSLSGTGISIETWILVLVFGRQEFIETMFVLVPGPKNVYNHQSDLVSDCSILNTDLHHWWQVSIVMKQICTEI